MKNVNKLLYRLVAILMVCVLVSTSLLCGLLAKYSTSGTGEDSARVIKFFDINITETGDFISNKGKNNAIILPGVDLKKDVKVSFGGSEAATIVFVELDLTGNWAKSNDKFEIKDNGEEMLSFFVDTSMQSGKQWKYLDDTISPYVYYCVLEPNQTITNMNVIKDSSDDVDSFGDIHVSKYIRRKQLKTLTGISIKVQATAVQANGFETVGDAWDSVKNK